MRSRSLVDPLPSPAWPVAAELCVTAAVNDIRANVMAERCAEDAHQLVERRTLDRSSESYSGGMLALFRKTFSGSNLRLSATSLSHCAVLYAAARTRLDGSSLVKFT